MAIDESLKLEIRARYESSNLSVAKVLEGFPNCDVSPKTVESWIKKEDWKKNRFANEKEAIKDLIEGTLPIEKAKDILKESMTKDKKFTDIDLDRYGKVLASELCFDVLSAKKLQLLMGENLLRAKTFVDNSKSISTNATYHNMLTTTVKALYGEIKHINPTRNNDKIYTDAELEAMSLEELDRIIEE